MHVSLLTAFQTEPWSLMFLGATLLALSSVARRRSPSAHLVIPASLAHAIAAPHRGLRRLRSRFATAA